MLKLKGRNPANVRSRKRALKEYYAAPLLCKYCNKVIVVRDNERVSATRKKTFCNHSCAAKYNNKVKAPPRYCKVCDTVLKYHQSKYCSHVCQHEGIYLNYIKDWKAGKQNGVVGTNTSKHLKKYFRKKYKNKCQSCGWAKENKFTKVVPLELHHVNGNWRDNEEKNLRLLCPNCHALTETFRGANIGRHTKQKERKLLLPGRK